MLSSYVYLQKCKKMAMRLPLPTLIVESVSTQKLQEKLLLNVTNVGIKWSADPYGDTNTHTVTEKIDMKKSI
jgi:hypothetical protein